MHLHASYSLQSTLLNTSPNDVHERRVVLLCGDVHRLHNVNELLFVGHRPIDLVVVTWAGPGTPQVQINESKTRVQAARPCSWYRRGT